MLLKNVKFDTFSVAVDQPLWLIGEPRVQLSSLERIDTSSDTKEQVMVRGLINKVILDITLSV